VADEGGDDPLRSMRGDHRRRPRRGGHRRRLEAVDLAAATEAVELALPAARSSPTHSGQSFSTAWASDAAASGTLSERVLNFERAQVLKELEQHNRRITQTAKALGLERSHLYKKCQQLGIDLKSNDER